MTRCLRLIFVRTLAGLATALALATAVYAAQLKTEVRAEEQLCVTLPYFLTSTATVAGFVWALARYSLQRERQLERLEEKVESILTQEGRRPRK